MKNTGENFWSGEHWLDGDVVVNKMQASDGKRWLETDKKLCLDPSYSEWSVRIFDPNNKSLSWVLSTLAIIPKSLIRQVHALLGEYLDTYQADVHEVGQPVELGSCCVCSSPAQLCDGNICSSCSDEIEESCGTCRRWDGHKGDCPTDAGEWCDDWEELIDNGC